MTRTCMRCCYNPDLGRRPEAERLANSLLEVLRRLRIALRQVFRVMGGLVARLHEELRRGRVRVEQLEAREQLNQVVDRSDVRQRERQ